MKTIELFYEEIDSDGVKCYRGAMYLFKRFRSMSNNAPGSIEAD